MTDETIELTVPPTAAGERLDLFLAGALPHTSRSQLQLLIRRGLVLVDGAAKPARFAVKEGQQISVSIPPPPPLSLQPEAIPLDIVFEDDSIVVVNKPPGLVVHPGAGRTAGTLVNALLAHTDRLSAIGGPTRPGIVHRLDKDTSGLLVVAKTDPAHTALVRMIESRQIERRYLALIWGIPKARHFAVDAPIGRKPSDRKQMAVITTTGKRARHALTDFELLEEFAAHSLVEAKLSTGRTHQVRVHLSYAGHPIVGDPTYGRRLARAESAALENETKRLIAALPGQALHAYRLAFAHPITQTPLSFQADLPPAFAQLLHHLRLVKKR